MEGNLAREPGHEDVDDLPLPGVKNVLPVGMKTLSHHESLVGECCHGMGMVCFSLPLHRQSKSRAKGIEPRIPGPGLLAAWLSRTAATSHSPGVWTQCRIGAA